MTVLRHKRRHKENFKKSLAGRSRRRAVGRRGDDRRTAWGQPAGSDPRADALRGFLVDFALTHDAPERLLQVVAGAAEAVVKLELAQGGVEVVAPQQADHATAGPDAFRM